MPFVNDATPVAATGDSITTALAGAFAAMDEPTQVDEVVVEPVAEPIKVEEPAIEEPKVDDPKEEPKVEEPKEGEVVDEPDDTEVEEGYYPADAEELKTKWPRAVPLKCINQAAEWAAGAQKGQELETKIGGEPFIEPLSKMSSALRDTSGNPSAFQPFFEGILEASGDEALVTLVGQSLYMAFKQVPEWQADPKVKDFADQLALKANAALEARFGTPVDRLELAASFDKDGSLEKFTQFLDADFKDEDGEFDTFKFNSTVKSLYDEVRAIRNNPVNKKLAEENTLLKRQQEKPAETKVTQDTEVEGTYAEYVTNAVDNVLDTVILKNSVLKPVDTDSDDLKADKLFHRNALARQMREEMGKHKSNLFPGFKNGKQTTSVYRSEFTTALSAAVTAIDKDRQHGEQTIAKRYGQTRNAKLVTKETEKADVPATPLTPTVVENHKPPVGMPKTTAEIQKSLEQAYAELG